MTILNILTVIPLAPLFAACFVGLFGKKLPKYYSFGVPIFGVSIAFALSCLLYTSPSPRDAHESRMPSSA